MEVNNPVVQNDLKRIVESVEWTPFKNSRILITGSTGLIGKWLVWSFLRADSEYSLNLTLVLVIRNREKAAALFGEDDRIEYIVSDINELDASAIKADYIIHAASQTNSRAMVEQPVETAMTAINGTLKLLELSRKTAVRSMVYLSSMEVYGEVTTEEKITEDTMGLVNQLNVRSSYPEGKRMCENLCAGYASEYHVSCKIARLAQTFGPGIPLMDNRVFAQFMRSARNREDIVLHTRGESKRCYLYTADCVTAILTILLRGEAGRAYNCANEKTYKSIFEMAKLVAGHCAEDRIKVIVEDQDPARFGYPKTNMMNLDASALEALGWKPQFELEEMLKNTYDSLEGQ
ncbi:MAG: NAD(P)-dependent oxidoreductase [Erysipelotrichaceae bacterium]|nr:NAD(P)-dependent oxidoreductase [Erysipelotrichaceae bacterium]